MKEKLYSFNATRKYLSNERTERGQRFAPDRIRQAKGMKTLAFWPISLMLFACSNSEIAETPSTQADLVDSVSPSTTVLWKAPIDGEFGDAANWVGGRVPGPNDRAVIAVPGDYEVKVDQDYRVKDLFVGRMPLDIDSDQDHLPDEWEMTHFGELTFSATEDTDQDGRTNIEEYSAQTDPNDAASDSDGTSGVDGYSEIASGPEIILAESSNVDLLTISPPNAAGISINHFSELDVVERPLSIVNIPRAVQASGDPISIDAARLIVIVAEDTSIKNLVQVLGPPSDVLFISPNAAGSISCDGCSFENILRLSFARATPATPLDVEGAGQRSQVGELTPMPDSLITIANLPAPGAMTVEVIAGRLELTGTMKTNQPASIGPNGSYVPDTEGEFTVGTGSVNLVLGPITWNYDENMLKSVVPYTGDHSDATSTLGGRIESSGVKVSAARTLVFNTAIDTRTDLLASVSYQDSALIPQEGIDVRAFGNSSLSIGGDLKSEGKLNLSAAVDLNVLSESVDIEAENIELVAGGKLTNNGKLHGEQLSLGADRINNQGELVAEAELNAWADKELANQYGGVIKGHTVRLQSATQAIRNGSRTPYDSRDIETDGLLNYARLQDDARLGTLFAVHGQANTTGTNISISEKSSAHIVANRLEIQGEAFENINPYYERADSEHEIEFDEAYLGQVSVSAESYLGIKASRYITNSSAYIVLNQPDGVFESHTGLFTNERYLTYSNLILDPDIRNDLSPFGNFVWEYTTSTFTTQSIVDSPPGVVAVMGRAEVAATQGIINNMSYLEIFGDALFDTPLVNDIGLEDQSIKSVERRVRENLANAFGELKPGPYANDSSWITFAEISYSLEQDSLFLIHGDLRASAALGWFRNHKPLRMHVAQAIRNSGASDVSTTAIETAMVTGRISGASDTRLSHWLSRVYQNVSAEISQFLDSLIWWE